MSLEQNIIQDINNGLRSEEIACKYNISNSKIVKLRKKFGLNNVDLNLYKIYLKEFIFYSFTEDLINKFNSLEREDIKVSIICNKSLSKSEYKKSKERINKEMKFNIINEFIFLKDQESEEDLINYFKTF